MQVARKIFSRTKTNLFFNQFSGDALFSSLVSFAFFDSCFFCCCRCLLFFEIKNVYADTCSIKRVGEW